MQTKVSGSGKFNIQCLRPDSDCLWGVRWYSALDEWRQVAVLSNQVIVIWRVSLVVTVIPWQYPLLQGRLLTPHDGNGAGHGLWVRAGLGGSDGTRPEWRDPEHHLGPPRIFPLARNLPSRWDIPGGRPVGGSPGCPVLNRWRVLLGLREEEVLPVPQSLRQRERRAWGVKCGRRGECDTVLGAGGGRWLH